MLFSGAVSCDRYTGNYYDSAGWEEIKCSSIFDTDQDIAKFENTRPKKKPAEDEDDEDKDEDDVEQKKPGGNKDKDNDKNKDKQKGDSKGKVDDKPKVNANGSKDKDKPKIPGQDDHNGAKPAQMQPPSPVKKPDALKDDTKLQAAPAGQIKPPKKAHKHKKDASREPAAAFAN